MIPQGFFLAGLEKQFRWFHRRLPKLRRFAPGRGGERDNSFSPRLRAKLFFGFPNHDPRGVQQVVRPEFPPSEPRAGAVRAGAGVDEDGAGSCATPGFHVPERISDEEGPGKIDGIVFRRPENHAGFGLAAETAVGGLVRAVIHAEDITAVSADGVDHEPVEFLQPVLALDALGDAGLVGDDNDPEPGPGKQPERLEHMGGPPPLLDRGGIIAALDIDDAVTVEENEMRASFGIVQWPFPNYYSGFRLWANSTDQ